MEDPALGTEVAYFEYGEEDRAALAGIAPVLEKNAERLVSAFYRHLLSFPETQHLLRDPEVTRRLLAEQRRYLLSLAGPVIDADYMKDRRRIGQMHERIALEPRWYVGAYALYLSLLTPLVCEYVAGDVQRGERTLVALQKLILFDMQIAMGAYIERRERDLQHLNEELASAGRKLAKDLESTGAELRSAAERAHVAERLASIGVLVAGLAHEIGTPMGVIQGHAKLLESAVEGDDARWRLRTIQEQIGRISRIIESLLGMARPSRSRLVPVSLAGVVETTIAFLDEKLRRRSVETRLELEPVRSVQGDPERLQQVLLNLFLNAADAMPDGGVLTVGLSESPGQVEIRVADTGGGIESVDPERVFEPFLTTKSAGEGHGLGLAVAHDIVTEHGGRIEVLETNESGTCFRIVLPLEV